MANKCFLLFSTFPPSPTPSTHTQNTNLENHPWTGELLWKSTSQQRHSSPLMQKQNVRLETPKKMKGIVSLYLHYPSLKAAELIANKVFLGPKFLPWGKVRAHEWAPGFPSCTGRTLSKRPTAFLLHPEHGLKNYRITGQRAAWEQQPRVRTEHSKGAWPLCEVWGAHLVMCLCYVLKERRAVKIVLCHILRERISKKNINN